MLSHDQNTIPAEIGCVEMHDFCMADFMVLTCHVIKARTHACAENSHFSTQCKWRVAPCFRDSDDASLGNVQFLHGHKFLL